MKYEPLDQDLGNELKQYAQQHHFPHVIYLLELLSSGKTPILTEFDKEQLVLFSRLIKLVAALQSPLWNDDLENYKEDDGDEYLEVINGIYGKFSSWLYDELGVAAGSSALAFWAN